MTEITILLKDDTCMNVHKLVICTQSRYFNQMLELGLKGDKALSIWDIDSLNELQSLPIVFDQHCYGCSAGAGSSCSGSLA